MNIQGRILIVVNPKAVRLRKSGIWEAVQAAAADAQVMLMETEYAGHARRFCGQHASEFDKVIVVGRGRAADGRGQRGDGDGRGGGAAAGGVGERFCEGGTGVSGFARGVVGVG